jgi:hypothetical protein
MAAGAWAAAEGEGVEGREGGGGEGLRAARVEGGASRRVCGGRRARGGATGRAAVAGGGARRRAALTPPTPPARPRVRPGAAPWGRGGAHRGRAGRGGRLRRGVAVQAGAAWVVRVRAAYGAGRCAGYLLVAGAQGPGRGGTGGARRGGASGLARGARARGRADRACGGDRMERDALRRGIECAGAGGGGAFMPAPGANPRPGACTSRPRCFPRLRPPPTGRRPLSPARAPARPRGGRRPPGARAPRPAARAALPPHISAPGPHGAPRRALGHAGGVQKQSAGAPRRGGRRRRLHGRVRETPPGP